MKQIKLFSAVLMALLICLFSTSAFAQAGNSGADLRIGLSGTYIYPKASMSIGDLSLKATNDSGFAGLNGKLEFGYRWQYFGAYLAQDLGGHWYIDASENADNPGRFFGGTYALFRGILPIMNTIQLELGLGVGLAYADGEKGSKKLPLISNENAENSVAFALKAALSFIYYVTDMAGIGIFIDYNYIHNQTSKYGVEIKLIYHQIYPGIQASIRF